MLWVRRVFGWGNENNVARPEEAIVKHFNSNSVLLVVSRAGDDMTIDAIATCCLGPATMSGVRRDEQTALQDRFETKCVGSVRKIEKTFVEQVANDVTSALQRHSKAGNSVLFWVVRD